jgi:hypothetical protein
MWMFIIGSLPMLLSGLCAWGLSRNVDVLYERKAPHTEHDSDAEPAVAGHVPARP